MTAVGGLGTSTAIGLRYNPMKSRLVQSEKIAAMTKTTNYTAVQDALFNYSSVEIT